MGFEDIIKEGEQLVEAHPDQAKAAFDKAAELVDGQTGNKYEGQIKQGEELLEGKLGLNNGQ